MIAFSETTVLETGAAQAQAFQSCNGLAGTITPDFQPPNSGIPRGTSGQFNVTDGDVISGVVSGLDPNLTVSVTLAQPGRTTRRAFFSNGQGGAYSFTVNVADREASLGQQVAQLSFNANYGATATYSCIGAATPPVDTDNDDDDSGDGGTAPPGATSLETARGEARATVTQQLGGSSIDDWLGDFDAITGPYWITSQTGRFNNRNNPPVIDPGSPEGRQIQRLRDENDLLRQLIKDLEMGERRLSELVQEMDTSNAVPDSVKDQIYADAYSVFLVVYSKTGKFDPLDMFRMMSDTRRWAEYDEDSVQQLAELAAYRVLLEAGMSIGNNLSTGTYEALGQENLMAIENIEEKANGGGSLASFYASPNAAGGIGYSPAGPFALHGNSMSWSLSLNDIRRRAASQRTAYAAGGPSQPFDDPFYGSSLMFDPRFNASISGSYTFSEDGRAGARGDGHTVYVSANASYQFAPWLGVGAQVRYRFMSNGRDDGSASSDAEGFGGSIFAKSRLPWGTILTPLVAYERTRTDLTQTVAGVPLTGSFDTDIWTFGLKAAQRFGLPFSERDRVFYLQPQGSLSYIMADRKGYTRSDGLFVPSDRIKTGSLQFGGRAGVQIYDPGHGIATIEPFIGLNGVWSFKVPEDQTIANGVILSTPQLFASIVGGLDIRTISGATLNFSVMHSGLGSDVSSTTVSGRLNIPF